MTTTTTAPIPAVERIACTMLSQGFYGLLVQPLATDGREHHQWHRDAYAMVAGVITDPDYTVPVGSRWADIYDATPREYAGYTDAQWTERLGNDPSSRVMYNREHTTLGHLCRLAFAVSEYRRAGRPDLDAPLDDDWDDDGNRRGGQFSSPIDLTPDLPAAITEYVESALALARYEDEWLANC